MSKPWDAYWRLMRFDRPIGIVLLLWPTWWALLLAGDGRPAANIAIIFTLGVIVMRAAGCVMNDIADRDFDPHVKRTRERPLASGALNLRQALVAFLILMMLALGLVLMTNRLTIQLAFAGALLASTYPFFKRFTHFPQIILGMAFGWGIPMAFAAQTAELPLLAWLVFAINVVWAVIYDTLYAMVDRDDDLKIGVKSTAILFGRFDRVILACLMIAMVAMLSGLGLWQGLGWSWFAATGLVAVCFAYQLWLARRRAREDCFRAFLNNNWVGLIILLGLLGHYLTRA